MHFIKKVFWWSWRELCTYVPTSMTSRIITEQSADLFHGRMLFYVRSKPGCQMVHFQTKIAVWENSGWSCYGRCWPILWTFGLFYGHLIYLMAIWYISWWFGIFFSISVYCTKRNLATLVARCRNVSSQSSNRCDAKKTSFQPLMFISFQRDRPSGLKVKQTQRPETQPSEIGINSKHRNLKIRRRVH
jgi:hypothetical protein